MMKRWFLVCLLIVPFFMFGCKDKADDGKIKVYASFYTMYDFAQKIAGDDIKVYNIMPQGADAHDYEPSTKDIINLNKADIFIYNGLGMEHWVDKVLASLNNPNLKVVKASDGVSIIDGGHEDEHEGEEEHNKADPHIWLSPKNAKIILSNIKDAFVEIDPDNAQIYQSNYERYAQECDNLDNEFRTQLQGFEKRDIIVSHQAFSYLCQEYNLNQIALLGLHSESSNPKKLAEIIQEIKTKNIKVVFYEPASGKELFSNLNKEDGVKVELVPLNPLESLTSSEIKNNADYFSVMRANLFAIKNALTLQNGI